MITWKVCENLIAAAIIVVYHLPTTNCYNFYPYGKLESKQYQPVDLSSRTNPGAYGVDASGRWIQTQMGSSSQPIQTEQLNSAKYAAIEKSLQILGQNDQTLGNGFAMLRTALNGVIKLLQNQQAPTKRQKILPRNDQKATLPQPGNYPVTEHQLPPSQDPDNGVDLKLLNYLKTLKPDEKIIRYKNKKGLNVILRETVNPPHPKVSLEIATKSEMENTRDFPYPADVFEYLDLDHDKSSSESGQDSAAEESDGPVIGRENNLNDDKSSSSSSESGRDSVAEERAGLVMGWGINDVNVDKSNSSESGSASGDGESEPVMSWEDELYDDKGNNSETGRDSADEEISLGWGRLEGKTGATRNATSEELKKLNVSGHDYIIYENSKGLKALIRRNPYNESHHVSLETVSPDADYGGGSVGDFDWDYLKDDLLKHGNQLK